MSVIVESVYPSRSTLILHVPDHSNIACNIDDIGS